MFSNYCQSGKNEYFYIPNIMEENKAIFIHLNFFSLCILIYFRSFSFFPTECCR